MRTAHDGAAALREALRAEGGAVAGVLGDLPAGESRRLDDAGPAQLAAAGPRTRSREREYALLLGDQLYALGLDRLAALGDLDAVAELADVISLAAQAHSAADRDLAAAAWEAGAVSVGWGSSEEHRRAKERARAHDPEAAQALRAAAAAARRSQAL